MIRSNLLDSRNTSLLNLQYLDSRYAVADLANLVQHLRAQHGNPPVIAHGYDHGGALAVWLRQRYPHLVDGVWASSASLLARKDFGEYMANIGIAIRQVGGDRCYQDIEEAFGNMGTLYDNGDYATLEEHFYLCQPFSQSDPIEEAAFFAYYSQVLSEILRYSHALGIETLCDYLDGHEDPMVGVANFIKLVLPVCVPLNVYEQIEMYQNVDWDTEATELGLRQLSYQYCREFGWFRSSSYDNQPFGNRFPVENFHDACQLLYGPRLDDVPRSLSFN